MNYGYTVVRGALIRGIVTSGLSPGLGVWHRNRANPFALADDLIEPFRPVVDYVVQQLPRESSIRDRDVKSALVDVLSVPVAGSGDTVNTAIVNVCQRFARYVEGEVPVLSVPVWGGRSG